MEVVVLKSGQKQDGTYWFWIERVDKEGWVSTAICSNKKEIKVKDGKIFVPAKVLDEVEWKY